MITSLKLNSDKDFTFTKKGKIITKKFDFSLKRMFLKAIIKGFLKK